ncbi:beta-phosphoglucomutase [Kordiimonas pumila]|uniref:Beta-phosphoglucomutase n=1 Tax=Kordiimonas pumila TaxID=2161677 RepID=A0ABV7D615_9PROT|nr:beta-phosphoglucomutase [Kordiimonas pumila]
MTPKTCIFDLDGVVVDTAKYHFQAWRRLAEFVGVAFTHEDNDNLKGVGRMESLDYILAKSPRLFSNKERLALADQKNDDYKELIKGINAAELLPGVSDTFTWLREEGWKIGLASASRNAPQVIKSLGVEGVFDYVADAGKILNGKPAPDIFLDVARALNSAPTDAIGVEDAVAGVTAIKAAGMIAVGIGDPALLHEADVVMPTPEGLIECFKLMQAKA